MSSCAQVGKVHLNWSDSRTNACRVGEEIDEVKNVRQPAGDFRLVNDGEERQSDLLGVICLWI
jgi:hypothetical protein